MALFTKKKKKDVKVPVKDDKTHDSVLRGLQETPVNDEIQLKKKKFIFKVHLRSILFRIITFTCVVLFTFTFVFGLKTIESNDMYPNIKAGDVILYFRLSDIKNNDAVIYKTPDGVNIGRVVATPGDAINKTNGGLLTINGYMKPIEKKAGIFYKTKANDAKLPLKVKEKHYYILGDSRETSKDSRKYGEVNKKDIQGKIFMTLRRRAV